MRTFLRPHLADALGAAVEVPRLLLDRRETTDLDEVIPVAHDGYRHEMVAPEVADLAFDAALLVSTFQTPATHDISQEGYTAAIGASRFIVTNSGSQGGPVAYVRTVFAVYEVACVTRPRMFLRCYEPRI